ncbi:EAL domain-containing protein [Janthinobacterium sp. CG3]|uniref:EAL domain-containing protein n=2 Tax=unclassified Janthinobacterium TaxID=2610881 RepID=UPI0009D94AF4
MRGTRAPAPGPILFRSAGAGTGRTMTSNGVLGTATAIDTQVHPDVVNCGSGCAYRILGLIARRNGSSLYFARSAQHGGAAIVKLLAPGASLPEQLSSLRREYAALRSLDVHGIVKALALFDQARPPLMVLDHAAGESFEAALQCQSFDVATCLRLACQLARIVAGLHAAQLIHRDIRPANFLLGPQRQLLLVDLSLATGDVAPSAAAGAAPVADWAYVSPEQTGRMNRGVDYRSDFYSLGVTLYRMLTGQLPCRGNDPMEWAHCHIARVPRPPAELAPGIPAPLSDIVMKLLAKMPEDRYQSAHGLLHDLDTCLAQWEAGAAMPPFPLGAHDRPERIQIPQRLVGRDSELAQVVGSFDAMLASGRAALLLITGYAGIGKSALAGELRQPVLARRGFFISGKFDQYQREIPYATVTDALRELVRQILTESEEGVAAWRRKVRAAVGANGKLIVDVLPQAELIIGAQAPVPEVPPAEAENRFLMVFERFIRAFAQAAHPLTLFLDDLQWADAASLRLVAQLLSSPSPCSLLVAGAYRDNEVGPGHPLSRMLVGAGAGAVTRVVLAPLAEDAVRALIDETLRCGHGEAAQLAQLVYEKTRGNPFFMTQFIGELEEERMLAFDPQSRTWRWDLGKISAKGYTDNVAVLMVAKMARLPDPAKSVLQRLACLGSGASTAALANVCGRAEPATQAALSAAQAAGLVTRTDNAVYFLHDRVQEAAYLSIPLSARAALHLQIGRALIGGKTPAQVEEAVFAIVDQFNRGGDAVADPGDKALLCQLNLMAGKKALASRAHASACNFLDRAMALLPPTAWQTQYQQAYAIALALSECEHFAGNFQRADQLANLILTNARSPGDCADVYLLRIQLYQTAGRYDDALGAMVEGVGRFGLHFPTDMAAIEAAIAAEVRDIAACLRDKKMADVIDAPESSDSGMASVIALLVEAIAPAYSSRPEYFALITAWTVKLSLRHGHTAGSCFAYSVYGTILLSRFGDVESAFVFSELALQLNSRRAAPRFKGRVLFVHAITFMPWKEAIAGSVPMLEQAFGASLEVGDLVFANYIAVCHFWPMLQQGAALDEVLATARRNGEFARDNHNETVYDAIRFEQQLVLSLKGRTRAPGSLDGDDFDEVPCLAALEKANFSAGLYIAYIVKQMCAFMYGDYAGALAHARQAALNVNQTGTIMVLDGAHHFYFALALAALCPSEPGEEQARFAGLLATELERHALWAAHCPQNYLSSHALVGAEIARIEGRAGDAERLYQQAIGAARDNGLVQNEAIAYELASKFYRGRGFELIADTYLSEACTHYRRWGAQGKAEQLHTSRPALSAGAVAVPLDVLSITKASQAISSRITLNELADTLLHIVLENAGAQAGSLLLSNNEGLELAAEASVDQDAVQVRIHDRVAPAEASLPAAILNYVQHSREEVLLPDVAQPNVFSSDPYFARHQPKSVLCLPILRQGGLVGLLYLENNLLTHAFSSERVAALKLLTSQAAISLENAQLYADLRQENSRRKRAEQQATQLAAIVTSSDDAIIGKTLDGTIVSWNAGAERMYGYSANEALGRPISILAPPELPDETPGILARLRRRERVLHHETVRMRKDGRRIDVSISFSPICDASGRLTGASLIAREIGERKLAEQALREKDAQIRRLVESNMIGVTFWNTAGDISYANDAFLELSGYSREDLASGELRWSDMTPPEYHALDVRAIEEAMRTGTCAPYEKEYIRKDGQRVHVLIGRAMFEGSRESGVSFVLDLSARKQAEEQIRHMADHDALTGLPNRALLQDRMTQAIAQAHRNQGRVAILFIDLDYFKNINDSLGHHIGDIVLQMTSVRLQKCLREGDSVARLGGDEFVLSLPMVNDSGDAAQVAQKVLDILLKPFIVEGHELHVSGSVGISLYPDDGTEVESLMRAADTAMYHAKETGRGNFQFFTPALNHAAQQRMVVGNRLRQALARQEFVLHYQPQVDMQSGTTFSTEALLRWQPPGGAPISCGAFIANAEESGLIVPLGEWVLREACKQLRVWHDGGRPELKIAVNLSPRQLEQSDFCALVAHILAETGVPASALELEITESTLMQRSDFNLAALTRLSKMGVRLSIDDFGTGYSSLGYLQRFPVHALKIDQSFVRDIGTDPNDTALVSAIIAMAASLHLNVMAEGVETSQQAEFLLAHNCLAGQGFYFSKAVPAEMLSALFKADANPVLRTHPELRL